MIHVLFPGQPIPEWLERIERNPEHDAEYGPDRPYTAKMVRTCICWRSANSYHVMPVFTNGETMCVTGDGLNIKGQGGGVTHHYPPLLNRAAWWEWVLLGFVLGKFL